MVLLSKAVRDSPTAGKLQALEGWLVLLKALAKYSPNHLAGMANQVCHISTHCMIGRMLIMCQPYCTACLLHSMLYKERPLQDSKDSPKLNC